MSHKHNYTNYSKPQETPVVPVTEEVVAPVVEDEPVVTPDPEVTPVIEDAPVADPEPENDDLMGVVVDCARLNVRKEASADAAVLTTIPAGAEVQINIFESTNDFYKVCTEAGVEGYCMAGYIKVED